MGNLQWSSPKTVKNGTLIVVSAKFPDSVQGKKDIWDLWKLKKEAVKKDGFSVGKDNMDGSWKISYFHTINDNSYEKTGSGKHLWNLDLDKKIMKWKNVLEQVHQFTSEKTESEVLNTKSESKPGNSKPIRKEDIELEYENNDDDDLAELERALKGKSYI
jgi:hypothetical protein